ncbi:MAG: hypothetical protein VW299_01540 [Alphaproteobacteria bacterium]
MSSRVIYGKEGIGEQELNDAWKAAWFGGARGGGSTQTPEQPTITTEPPAPTPPPKKVPGPGTTPPKGGGGGGYRPPKKKVKPVADEVIKELLEKGGKYVDNSTSVRDVNQNIGKQGDMNTNIVDSNFGDNAQVGNDNSETTGEQRVGNDYEEYELNLPGGAQRPEVVNNGLTARDINQNIGKQGDSNTDIEGSTFGDGAVIGNDFSTTQGTQRVGNNYSKRAEAKAKAAMFKDGLFGGDGMFGSGGLRFS